MKAMRTKVTPINSVITEVDLQQTLWRLARQSSEIFAAVSYCGLDAAYFFPERSRPPRIKVIVDMSRETVKRGLTNPVGVSKLCQIADVRSLRGLHSKVVVFDRRAAIVGSVNFSKSSIESQHQCCILTTDKYVIKQLREWLHEQWNQSEQVRQHDCKKYQRLFPGQRSWTSEGRKTGHHGRFKTWKIPLQDYILEQGDFKTGLSDSQLKRAIHQFKTKQCGYYADKDDKRITCAMVAKENDERDKRSSRPFHSLLRRINRWGDAEKEELFNLAYTHGRAAARGKPRFMRQRIGRIQNTMRYLFSEEDDSSLLRFEQVVKGRYKLSGMSYCGIAFLMHLWKPCEFSIWNGSVDKGLKKLKLEIPHPYSGHIAQGYQDRMAALRWLMKQTHLTTFQSVDHFVDAFGKGHLKL